MAPFSSIGVPPNSGCSSCSGANWLLGNECVNSCDSSSYSVEYPDGGKGCRQCPSAYNMVLNSDRSGCTCRTGFVAKNGICTLVKNTTPAPMTAATVIPNDFTQTSYLPTITDNAPIPPRPTVTPSSNNNNGGSGIIIATNNVVEDCSKLANSYYTGFRCVCKPGYKN